MSVMTTLGVMRDSPMETVLEVIGKTGGCSFTGVTKIGRMMESMLAGLPPSLQTSCKLKD